MLIAPYGSWPSPISGRDLTRGVVGLSRGIVVAERVYWAESRPDENGRTTLVRQDPDGARVELTPDFNVRNAINEYGGGEWTVISDVVVFSSYPGHSLYVLEPGSTPRLLARGGDHRFGSLAIELARRVVLAVREDHSVSDRDCTNAVVVLDLDSENDGGGRVIAQGADFYASPTMRPDGPVAWVEWNHPNMPWDTTSLMVTDFEHPGRPTRIAGGDAESVLYPAWDADGSLVFLSDASGFWNFHRWDGCGVRPLHAAPWDFCGPMWRTEPPPYALIGDGRIGCSWLVDGFAQLGILNPAPDPTLARLDTIETDAVSVSLTGHGVDVVGLVGFADRPAELRRIDLLAGTSSLVRRSADAGFDRSLVSVAVPRSWSGPEGPVHAWYYPPTNPEATAPPDELPPVQVCCHGGPTGFASPEFRPATQYWTSRGIGILDVNYGGSAGFGRRYRERLSRRWGITDVQDCIDAAKHLVDEGVADPARLSIRGSSAGGYTVLQALVTTSLFAAGISLYGIGDLESLEADTHKFESRYTQNLVAAYPEGRAVYRKRSPIHHLDRLSCPMLILQGLQDRVVPPSQANAMAAALRNKGLPLAVVYFPEEGHGFRRADTIMATAEACLSFLGQVLGFTPADTLPILPIANLQQRERKPS